LPAGPVPVKVEIYGTALDNPFERGNRAFFHDQLVFGTLSRFCSASPDICVTMVA
jgi:hypothetical protein